MTKTNKFLFGGAAAALVTAGGIALWNSRLKKSPEAVATAPGTMSSLARARAIGASLKNAEDARTVLIAAQKALLQGYEALGKLNVSVGTEKTLAAARAALQQNNDYINKLWAEIPATGVLTPLNASRAGLALVQAFDTVKMLNATIATQTPLLESVLYGLRKTLTSLVEVSVQPVLENLLTPIIKASTAPALAGAKLAAIIGGGLAVVGIGLSIFQRGKAGQPVLKGLFL